MANRAYLYSSNARTLDGQAVHEEPYFDSRHVVPIAWFFFFDCASVHTRRVVSGGATWLDVLLVRQRQPALRDFAERMSYLQDIALESAVDYEVFLDRVGRFPSERLVLDPGQIVGGDGMSGTDAALLFKSALAALELRAMPAFLESLRPLIYDIADVDDSRLGRSLENLMIGVTYWP